MPSTPSSNVISLPERIGVELAEQLEEIIRIREKRRARYGDDYMDADLYVLFCQMRIKLGRYFQQLNARPDFTARINRGAAYDTSIDSLRDLVNFALFSLAKLEVQRDAIQE